MTPTQTSCTILFLKSLQNGVRFNDSLVTPTHMCQSLNSVYRDKLIPPLIGNPYNGYVNPDPTKAFLQLRLHLLRYALPVLHNNLFLNVPRSETPKGKNEQMAYSPPKTNKALEIDGWKTSLSFVKWFLFR